MPIFQKNLSEDQHSVYVSRSDRITVNQDPLSILQFSKKNDFLVLLLKGTKVAAMIPGRKRPAFYTDASLGIKDEDSRIPPQEFPLTSQSLFCADTTAAPPKLPWPRRGQTQAFLPIRDARQSGYRFWQSWITEPKAPVYRCLSPCCGSFLHFCHGTLFIHVTCSWGSPETSLENTHLKAELMCWRRAKGENYARTLRGKDI